MKWFDLGNGKIYAAYSNKKELGLYCWWQLQNLIITCLLKDPRDLAAPLPFLFLAVLAL